MVNDVELRDWFAGLAMQAFFVGCAIEGSKFPEQKGPEAAYALADLMLKARGCEDLARGMVSKDGVLVGVPHDPIRTTDKNWTACD